jgi:hypothetical protein
MPGLVAAQPDEGDAARLKESELFNRYAHIR